MSHSNYNNHQSSASSFFKTPSNTGKVFFGGKLIPEEKITRIGPDSFYIEDFMQSYFPQHLQPEAVFEQIRSSPDWVPRENPEILYRGNEINRIKNFATENTDIDSATGIPLNIRKYGYAGSQWLNLLNYRIFRDAGVDPIVQQLEKISFVLPTDSTSSRLSDGKNSTSALNEAKQGITAKPVRINHVITTAYETNRDGISLHHDNWKDIASDSLIVSLSLGDFLEMQIERDADGATATLLQKAGSLFAIGPITNRNYRHGIIPEENETVAKQHRKSPFDCRISIIGRDISTVVSHLKVISKCKSSIGATINRICGKSMSALSKEITTAIDKAGITGKDERRKKRALLKKGPYAIEWAKALRKREKRKNQYFKNVLKKLDNSKQTSYSELLEVIDLFKDCATQFGERNQRRKKRVKCSADE